MVLAFAGDSTINKFLAMLLRVLRITKYYKYTIYKSGFNQILLVLSDAILGETAKIKKKSTLRVVNKLYEMAHHTRIFIDLIMT